MSPVLSRRSSSARAPRSAFATAAARPSRRSSRGVQQVLLRGRDLVGHVEVVRAVDERGRLAAEAVHDVGGVDGVILVARAVVEQLVALELRLIDQLQGLADVVLERLLAARR